MLWVSWGSCSSSKLMKACVLNFLTQPFPFATQSGNWWLFPCCCRIRNWTRGRLGCKSRAAAEVHRNQVCGFPAGFRFVTASSSSSVKFSSWEKTQFIFHGCETRRGDGITAAVGEDLTVLSVPCCLSPSAAMVWVTWSISLFLAAEISSADIFLCTLDSASYVLEAEQFQKSVLLMRKKTKVIYFKVFFRNLAKCLLGFSSWVIPTVRISSGSFIRQSSSLQFEWQEPINSWGRGWQRFVNREALWWR